ncbi:MAG: FAD-dependent oxidoreductase, partial [Clostridiales Family XIII bacterium]|nr:FAD-dependent oxidoreductase [Clostridiales Family XIII bacterium]
MKFRIEKERLTGISASCEVLVAGGGIAGVAAALAAARKGKDVILLEREYALGGMATLGLIAIYLPLCDGCGRQVVFGLGEELLKESIRYGADGEEPAAWFENGFAEAKKQRRYAVQFNPQLFALRMEQMLVSLGVRILYGSLAAGVVREGDRIHAVIIENKTGRSAIAAGSVIDATGDADICSLAGVDTVLHAGGNGLASWYYYSDGGEVRLKMFGLADRAPDEEMPKDDDAYGLVKTESLDESFRFSGVDGEELSRAVCAAHEKMFADILERREENGRYAPVAFSTLPLVRMSRRLAGAYTLDESEVYRRAEDSVGMTGDWRKSGPVFEIPYRTLYTPALKNLLVAGRDISVTDAMWDITRVIPPCAVTGEAAGTAASLTDDFPNLDTGLLQRNLR